MARLMSVSHTEAQVRDRSKTVTRRLGWKHARVGDELRLVRKAMGLKKGEKVEDVARVRVTAIGSEFLRQISDEEVAREGFPEWTADEFVEFFCSAMRCTPEDVVTRIEWEYIDA